MSWLPSTGGGGADPQTAVNTADIATIEGEQTTQDGLIAANTSNIATNASGVSSNATTAFNLGTDVAGHHSRLATIDSDQVTQDSAIALNTAKVSYTDAAIVATAIQPADTVADLAPIPAITQSGTTYTLELSNVFSTVMLSNAALVTVTVPTNASVAFPTGTQISLQSLGAGGGHADNNVTYTQRLVTEYDDRTE